MNTVSKAAIDRMALAFLSAAHADRGRVLEILVEEFAAEAQRRGLAEGAAVEIARLLAENLIARVAEISASGGDVPPRTKEN
jgi:hypothetical protein